MRLGKKYEPVRFQANLPSKVHPRELTTFLSPPDISAVSKLPEGDRELHALVSPCISHLLLCNKIL